MSPRPAPNIHIHPEYTALRPRLQAKERPARAPHICTRRAVSPSRALRGKKRGLPVLRQTAALLRFYSNAVSGSCIRSSPSAAISSCANSSDTELSSESALLNGVM